MDYEDLLAKTVLPELEAGRPNFDKPHTKAVVEYIKAIMDNHPELNLDRDVSVIAAYAHDWGYTGLFQDGKQIEIDDVGEAKKTHMLLGVDKLTVLLRDGVFNFLSKERKQRAIHLVGVHDDLKVLRDTDELVLMEADTLGGLDVSKIKPTFNKLSNTKYMQNVRNKRYPLFITKYSKQQFEKLYKLREDYYKEL